MFPPGLEPGTFRVLGERDNRYTTETRADANFIAFINLRSERAEALKYNQHKYV